MGSTKFTTNTINIEDFKLFNDFPSGILILHLETKENPQDMRIVYGNSECRKLLGINTDDLPGKKIDTVLPELSERKIVQALAEVVFSQKAKDIKVISHKKKNTEPVLISVKAFPLPGNNVGVSFEDVTKIRSLQNTLKESEDRFKSILNNSNSIIYIKDLSGRYLLVNKKLADLMQINSMEVIGKSDYDIFPEQYAKNIASTDLEVIKNKKTIIAEEIIPVNDEPNTFLSSKFPIYDNKDTIYAMCCISTNITERKKAEEELNKIFNLSADLICIVSLKGDILKVNPAFEKVLGYKQQEFKKKTIFDFMYPEDIQSTINTVDEKLRNNKQIIMHENRYICKDGSVKWFSWISQPLYDKGLAFSIARDITSNKFHEKELIKAKEKAEEGDRLKSAFLANMSHEIRTPMNGILGFSKMLEGESLTAEKRKQYIEFVNSSVNQLLSIINDIIDFSKIEAGQLKLNTNDVDLNKIFEESYVKIDSKLKTQGRSEIMLKCFTAFEGSDCYIKGDEARIRQVLSKLLNNAMKFTNKGEIEFGYRLKDDSTVVFYVKDTGIGISKEKLGIVFEKFRQEDESFTRQYGGTGLGLSICKGIVKQMDGNIWVESDKGKGSTFYFTVPFKPSVLTNKKMKITNFEKEYDWSNRKILIVEDDLLGCEYLKEIMEPTNVSLVLVENGLEAISSVKDIQDIDLVLMDLRIPEMDGYTTTTEIKKIKPEIPVVVQTANALPEDKDRAEKAGCDDFVTKPINRKQLLAILNKYF